MLPGEGLPAEPPDASDYEVVTETVSIEGLLTADGIRFLFTSFVPNFMGFTAMGIILIVMIGVGVAERSGLIAALIRKLVASSPAGALTYIIVFLGIISSIASDACAERRYAWLITSDFINRFTSQPFSRKSIAR